MWAIGECITPLPRLRGWVWRTNKFLGQYCLLLQPEKERNGHSYNTDEPLHRGQDWKKQRDFCKSTAANPTEIGSTLIANSGYKYYRNSVSDADFCILGNGDSESRILGNADSDSCVVGNTDSDTNSTIAFKISSTPTSWHRLHNPGRSTGLRQLYWKAGPISSLPHHLFAMLMCIFVFR